MERDLKSFSEAYLKYCDQGLDFVVVTLTQVQGSAPQNLGAKMIVSGDKIHFGTVGGGKIEAHCLKVCQEMLGGDDRVLAHTWNLQKDIGMTCGGAVSFLFERSHISRWSIAIFGAGHVSQALTRTLLNLDCHLYVFDTRQEWLDQLPDAPKLTKYQLKNLSDGLDLIPGNSFVCSMTMGHAHDVPILSRALADFSFPYYGVIGSKAKRNAILKDLELDEAPFYCPMGEDLGSNTPYEIAVSIAAQLLKKRDALA